MRQKNINFSQSSHPIPNKYDDWVCLLCQNHNYSFRIICNRCRTQTKQQNAYLQLVYQQQLTQQTFMLSFTHSSSDFPNVLLLVINDEPWEEQPQKRDYMDTPNIKWINNLIEE